MSLQDYPRSLSYSPGQTDRNATVFPRKDPEAGGFEEGFQVVPKRQE